MIGTQTTIRYWIVNLERIYFGKLDFVPKLFTQVAPIRKILQVRDVQGYHSSLHEVVMGNTVQNQKEINISQI